MTKVLINDDYGDHLETVKLALNKEGIGIYDGVVTNSWAVINIRGGMTVSQTVFLTQLVLEVEGRSLTLQSLEAGHVRAYPQAISAAFR